MKAAMEDRTPRSSGETEEKKKKRSHEEHAKQELTEKEKSKC